MSIATITVFEKVLILFLGSLKCDYNLLIADSYSLWERLQYVGLELRPVQNYDIPFKQNYPLTGI